MNLTQLSAQQLAELINAASAELSSRLCSTGVERVQAERPSVVLREPAEDDKDFILRLKSHVYSGGYVTAPDRDRVAELAAAGYSSWIARQGLPTERETWAWRKLAERSRIKPARER